ncbi:MAG: AIR synthase related protein, partial [Bacillota bacterium]|nr:AIR synthase related protein [Bacillota bacterium]
MKITMAHGSGGKSSAQLMQEIFGKHFQNQVLDKMEDAAVLKVNGKIACSTDSFVVTPLVFRGGDIGKLCVCGTVNDLLMMGAVPKYLTCGFILEEGLEIDLLDQIAASMAKQAEEAGVMIVAGDTKVVEGDGGLYINTTGIGEIPDGRDVSSGNCRAGDAILLSGNLGDHHATILSHRM